MHYQNEFTGDLSVLATIAGFTGRRGSNWIKGRLKDQKLDVSFEMKVFADTSHFGIEDGRISKLFVHEGKEWTRDWDTCLINYERGWDIEPHSPKAIVIMDMLMQAIDGKSYLKDGSSA